MSSMMEHSDLVGEIAIVEKMSTAERLKHAKKRRQQQLKKFGQYEKALEKESNKKRKGTTANNKKNNKESGPPTRIVRVQFVNNVMLLEAAARNDIEEVRYLLMEGVSPDVTNEDGLTALHQCCIDDLEDMMKLLIEFGANINARDSELWTPLHAAATCGHNHLCKYLVEHGADLLAVNADGNMPYDICEDDLTLDYIESEMAKRGVTQELIDETRLSSEKTFLDDLRMLADKNMDLEFRGRCGETPLHIASANGFIQVTEFLLDHHVTFDAVDEDLWQPVHCAACWGQLPILELLVQNGADLEARTRTGETPFDICEDLELKQRLLEMKNEMETNKATRTRDHRHRRSQNTRSHPHINLSFRRSSTMSTTSLASIYNSNMSLGTDKGPMNHHRNSKLGSPRMSASVRRTSMREKSAISWKEAREEAQRLRETAAEEDEEDMVDSPNNGIPLTNGNHDESVPATNIDDVQINTDDDPPPPPPTVHHAPPPSYASLDRSTNQEQPPVVTPASPPPAAAAAETPPVPTDTTPPPPPSTQAVVPPTETSVSSQRAQDVNERKGSTCSAQVAPPSGTLADLKKQRAQRVNDALRLRDGGIPESPNTTQQSGGSNGYAVEPNGIRSSSNHEPPMHKYTTKSEIVGGNSSDTSCCVIL